MQEEIEREGAAAELDRKSRENLKAILEMVDDTHQLIVICTDLTGRTPTHVHIQGPSRDKVLLYGMLEVTRDCAALGGSNK